MVDIEKVIKGLECCVDMGCGGCPYFKNDPSCQDDKDMEALELLKEYKNEKERNPVIVCPHCGKRVK